MTTDERAPLTSLGWDAHWAASFDAAMEVAGVPARVSTAEHLAAIALEVGRAKDKARVLQFVEEGGLDAPRFEAMIARDGLQGRWEIFRHQFLE